MSTSTEYGRNSPRICINQTIQFVSLLAPLCHIGPEGFQGPPQGGGETSVPICSMRCRRRAAVPAVGQIVVWPFRLGQLHGSPNVRLQQHFTGAIMHQLDDKKVSGWILQVCPPRPLTELPPPPQWRTTVLPGLLPGAGIGRPTARRLVLPPGAPSSWAFRGTFWFWSLSV